MRDKQLDKWEQGHENALESDASGAGDYGEDGEEEKHSDEQDECDPADLNKFNAELHPETIERILAKFVRGIGRKFKKSNSQGGKDFCSLSGMRKLVKRHIRKHVEFEENSMDKPYWPFSKTRLLPKDVDAAYNIVKSPDDSVSDSQRLEKNLASNFSSEETVVRLLEDAIKSKMATEDPCRDNEYSGNLAQLINPSLDQVSEKFTLNERQDIAFRIAGSYLLDEIKRSLLRKTSRQAS